MAQLQFFTRTALKALGLGKRPKTVIFRCAACGYAEKDRVRKNRRAYALGTRSIAVKDHRLVLGCPNCGQAMAGDVVAASGRPRCHPRCRTALGDVCECECNGRFHGLAA